MIILLKKVIRKKNILNTVEHIHTVSLILKVHAFSQNVLAVKKKHDVKYSQEFTPKTMHDDTSGINFFLILFQLILIESKSVHQNVSQSFDSSVVCYRLCFCTVPILIRCSWQSIWFTIRHPRYTGLSRLLLSQYL